MEAHNYDRLGVDRDIQKTQNMPVSLNIIHTL